MRRDVPGWHLRPKKKDFVVAKTKSGKGAKWLVLSNSCGLPLGVRLANTLPGEVALAETTLVEVQVSRAKGRRWTKPKRMVTDRTYESCPLRECLDASGIALSNAYYKTRKKRRYEDASELRYNKKR